MKDKAANAAFKGRPWIMYGAIFVVWLAFCKPWFVDGSIIPYDAKNHFYAMIRFVAAAWHSGESATWAPYHFGGFPFVADPQSVIWTPSLWPAVLFSSTPSMAFVDFVHLTHLLVIGFAIAGFGRAKGWHPLACILAGMTAMMGGAITARLEHMLMTVSVMWLTVALWRLEMAVAKGGILRGLAFALPVALMLFNRDHVAYLGAFFLLIYWLVQVIPDLTEKTTRKETVLKAVPVLAGGAIAIIAASLPILMLLDLAANSNRPAFGLSEASWQSLHPVTLLTFIMPEFFGSLREGGAYWGPASNKWAETGLKMHRGMLHYYLGTLPVVMIFVVGLLNGWIFKRGARVFAATAFFMYFYALGRYTPFYEILHKTVPGVDLFRRPADAIFLVGIAASLLAGFVINQAYIAGRIFIPLREIKKRRLIAFFVVLAIVVFIAAHTALSYEKAAYALLSIGLSLALCAVFLTVMTVAVQPGRWALFATAGLVILSAGDLIFHTSGIRANARPSTYYLQQAKPNNTPLFTALSALLEERDETGVPYRVETIGLGATVQNIGLVAGVHDLLGYNPVRLAAFDALIAPDMQNNAPRRRKFGSQLTGYSAPLFDALGVKYIATSVPLQKLDPAVNAEKFKRVGTFKMVDREAHIYENATPQNRLILLPKAATDKVTATAYHHGTIKIIAKADTAKTLVLRDFYYPGWRAWVNGEEVRIEKHENLFRAVKIPAGESDIIMRFEPFSLGNLMRIINTQIGLVDG